MSVFDTAKSRISELAKLGVNQVGTDSVKFIQESINTPYPPSSNPGSPPHLRTGSLHAAVNYALSNEGLTVTVISTRDHKSDSEKIPFWLEFGTKNMAARPYMRPQMSIADFTVRNANLESAKVG